MKDCIEREPIPVPEDSAALSFLYKTFPGRLLLRILTMRFLSELAGRFLDSSLSRLLIPVFLRTSGIDLKEYVPCRYRTFNQCFSRRIRPELRPVDPDPDHFVSPCDGLLSVYPIHDGMVLPVKHSAYTIPELIRNTAAAEKFEGGTCLVFRLCVEHYHRYSYPVDGIKSSTVRIPGCLHTVRPIALKHVPVFTENSREYTLLHTKEFGEILQMEVGAMLVGKIANHHPESRRIQRGEEKGTFLYGGSTIILLVQKDRVEFPACFYETDPNQTEIPVKLGECLGCRKKGDK